LSKLNTNCNKYVIINITDKEIAKTAVSVLQQKVGSNMKNLVTNNVKEVRLTAEEFLSLLTILKSIRTVAISRKDTDEADMMSELVNELLEYSHEDDGTALLKLNTEKRFAFWLSLDTYRDFCKACNYQQELSKVEATMKKFK
jgi:signal transduction histidine kinase